MLCVLATSAKGRDDIGVRVQFRYDISIVFLSIKIEMVYHEAIVAVLSRLV